MLQNECASRRLPIAVSCPNSPPSLIGTMWSMVVEAGWSGGADGSRGVLQMPQSAPTRANKARTIAALIERSNPW